MSFSIWKFPLEITDSQAVEMPQDARILSVQLQNDTVTLWAVVMPKKRRVNRLIRIAGTGHNIDDVVESMFAYLGTVQDGRGLVWHVFDTGEEK